MNAVESVLRTELLDAIAKSLADSCARHGYFAAELITWYIMKQLILPPDVNEVTTQKEILTPPKLNTSVCLGSSLEVVGRDAAPAQLMHKDKAECTS